MKINAKSILAAILFLAIVLTASLTACSGENGEGGGSSTGESESVKTPGQSGDETKGPSESGNTYEPDPDGKYPGMVGLGSNGATYEVSSISVTNPETRKDIFVWDFKGEDPLEGWKYASAAGGSTDASSAEKAFSVSDSGDSKVLSFKDSSAIGAMAYFGDPVWNNIKYSVKMTVSDFGNGATVYFCVKDEKNYCEAVIGSSEGKEVSVNVVENGEVKKTETLPIVVTEIKSGEEFPVTVTVYADTIMVTINYVTCFDLYGESGSQVGGIGFGSWATGVSFDNIKVTSSKDGSVIYEEDFNELTTLEDIFEPRAYSWGNLMMDSISDPTTKDRYLNQGDWANFWVVESDTEGDHGNYFRLNTDKLEGGTILLTESLNNEEWTDYTLEFDARIDIPNEGWAIYAVLQDDDNFLKWNVGGWKNTQSCFEPNVGGSSSQEDKFDRTFSEQEWHHIKLVIMGNFAIGYVDGELINIHSF